MALHNLSMCLCAVPQQQLTFLLLDYSVLIEDAINPKASKEALPSVVEAALLLL